MIIYFSATLKSFAKFCLLLRERSICRYVLYCHVMDCPEINILFNVNLIQSVSAYIGYNLYEHGRVSIANVALSVCMRRATHSVSA